MVAPIFESPILLVIATDTSEIKSPACSATMVAPIIWSVPFRVWILTNPSSADSRMARSTCSKDWVKVSISIDCSCAS